MRGSVKDIALLGGWLAPSAEKVAEMVAEMAGQHYCLAGGWDTPT